MGWPEESTVDSVRLTDTDEQEVRDFNASSLRDKLDRRTPVGGLLRRGIEDGYLTVVLSRREAVDAEAELQRHGAEPAGWIRDDGRGRCLEGFVAVAIETHEREDWLGGRLVVRYWRLVGLEVDVYLAGRAENSRDAGNKFLVVFDERIDGCFLLLVFSLFRIVERLAEIDALAAEHDRTDRNVLLFLIQVGDDVW